MERTPRLTALQRSAVRTIVRRGLFVWLAVPVLACFTGCPSDTATKSATAPGRKPGTATAPPLASAGAATGSTPQMSADEVARQQVAATQHAQKVQDLIGRAQQSYRSGVSNYNSNRLDQARTDFDAAVDTMLSSGMDLKTDPQLVDEFERLLSAINSLEMTALKQGNGFSPKVEDAPLDVGSTELTFPSDPALVGRLAAEVKTTQSDFPIVVNDYVAGWISYFSNSPTGHAHLKRSLERAGRYKEMILKTLRDNGVPQDLIYQAVAESGFQPQALNRSSGAGGMWQFMPFSSYGLARNGYFDERFDPEKSTLAYAKYMKSLYAQLGDWYLAMAAYDWGPGNVQRVVSRTGYADFWELYRRNVLPAETRNYVPGIIAAMIMAKNPEKYGLADILAERPVLSDKVITSYAIDLKLVADLTEATVPEIVALNPALLRMATPRDISYELHLPPGTRDAFSDRLKDIPEEHRASWRFHVVKTGETMDGIAASLHAHATQIAEYNEVTPAQPIEAGDELVVPVETASAGNGGQQRYKTRRGDSLVSVADRFGVSVEQLREWNSLSSSRVVPGRTLYVAEPVRLAPSGRSARARRGHTTTRKTHTAAARSGRAGSSGRGSTRTAAHTGNSAARSAATAAHGTKAAHSTSANTRRSR